MSNRYDRRLTPFSGQIGHISLAEKMPRIALTEGEPARVSASLAFLYTSPQGAVDRQLIHGDEVLIIDRRDGYAFVMAQKDGFCGWVEGEALGEVIPPTHRIITPLTHLYSAPKVQAVTPMVLPLNAKIAVQSIDGKWAQTALGFVPASHLTPLDDFAADPVSVAETLLHTPYYWGGNSALGVDCSGLVQLAYHAAGRPMAGDSDLQAALGQDVEAGMEQRGDLIFWKGHVALVAGPNLILHANAHHMAVAYEPLDAAISRIEAAGDGPVTARKRH